LKLQLRLYQPGDFETLYQMDQVCYERGIAYSRRTLREFLGMPGAATWIAVAGTEVAGFLIALREASQGHIVTLDVSPQERRRGIGSSLVVKAEREMAAEGVRVVELETAVDNAPAILFWQKHGYRAAGIYRRYYRNRTDAFWMVKTL
jgi:ribosomal-protein-alanine N-acetyltransferase